MGSMSDDPRNATPAQRNVFDLMDIQAALHSVGLWLQNQASPPAPGAGTDLLERMVAQWEALAVAIEGAGNLGAAAAFRRCAREVRALAANGRLDTRTAYQAAMVQLAPVAVMVGNRLEQREQQRIAAKKKHASAPESGA